MLIQKLSLLNIKEIAEFLSQYLHIEESEVEEMLRYLKKTKKVVDPEELDNDPKIKFHVNQQELKGKNWKQINLDMLEVFRNGMINAEANDIEMHGCLIPVVKGSREKIHSLVKQICALMQDSCYAEESSPDDELYLLGSCMINLTPPGQRDK